MNKYCEHVFTNESDSEMCCLSGEVCPHFFKDIASNCCEKRAAYKGSHGQQSGGIDSSRPGVLETHFPVIGQDVSL
jgi:hypothetical protein